MTIRKIIARFLLVYCGFRKLHGGKIQRNIRSLLDEIDFQNFRDQHPLPTVKDRDELFRLAHEAGPSADPITYLEFGVFTGESMRKWTHLSKNADSRFYGFDSFEGLPETWNSEKPQGCFNVGGKFPQIDDQRVIWKKGWFEASVPIFAKDFEAQTRLIIHLDADLYSSTMIVLVQLDRFIKKGTVLIFDEFYDRDHEFKAFVDYQKIAKRKFRVLAQLNNYAKVCMEII
jgi:hypothetical protein